MHSETEGLIETPRWITSIASLRYSDLFASGGAVHVHYLPTSHILRLGSWEGDIRLWKLDQKLKLFSLIGTLPAPGVVNCLQILSVPKDSFPSTSWAYEGDASSRRTSSKVSTVLLVAGMGQEHRLGRWMKLKGDGVVNGTIVVALHPRTSA